MDRKRLVSVGSTKSDISNHGGGRVPGIEIYGSRADTNVKTHVSQGWKMFLYTQERVCRILYHGVWGASLIPCL